VATLLARPLTHASDPMAGFFCLGRSTWKQAAPLNPLGYKIGLELLIKGGCRRLKDVPIVFADRYAGKSKLNFNQQLLYLRHLVRLYRFKYPAASVLLLYVLPALILVWLAWFIVT
jgi:dolichol-phosphate mannosyltransferase